ncbi:MAG: ATP-binding protein [Bacteroidota bacterium]
MMLHSIRLHPFAGTSDQTFSFNSGLNVIYGPNEFGKSTMVHALHHVLFSPTQLSPKKMEELLKNIKPLNGSDTVCITLQFSLGTDTYTLEKNWGATASSRLIKSDGAIITDSSKIQEQILHMLPANEAVTKQIMIANQSELAEAVRNMSTDVQSSLSEKLRGAVIHGGGINGTLLQQEIENKVKEYFKRWDMLAMMPEGGSNRGIHNPWQKDKGLILEAWYAWEKAKLVEKETKDFEEENNRIQAELNQENESLKKNIAFLDKYKKPYDETNKRITLEADKFKYESALKEFSKDALEWPKKQSDKEAKEKSLKQAENELTEIDEEFKIAEKKKNTSSDISKLNNARKLLQEIADKEEALNRLPSVQQDDLKNIHLLQAELLRCRSLIEGQKLLLTLRSDVEGSIHINHSGNQSETLSLNRGQMIERNINGIIEWEWNGIQFTLQSTNEDIETLKKSLEDTESAIKIILNKYETATINDLLSASEEHKKIADFIKERKSNLNTLLGKENLQALELRCQDAEKLPDTRDYVLLNKLKYEKIQQIADIKAGLFQLNEDIRKLEEKHGSIENLDQRRLNGMAEVSYKNQEIEKLSKVPDEYTTSEAFSEDYKIHLSDREEQTNLKHQLEMALSNLRPPDFSLQDATELKIIAEKKFQQKVKEGLAYIRIEEVLNNMLEAANDNAFLPLHQLTEKYLNQLSRGRFNHIPFDTTQPQELTGPGLRIPVTHLSKGTKDLLALAFRLAAADIYLENSSGFIVMDDPLVDMDKGRRSASAEVLRNFAQHHQTILLTCHEEHVTLLC